MLHEAFETLAQATLAQAQRHYGKRLLALALFGSVARGTPRFDSDLDLLLVCDGLPSGRMRRVEEFEAVEKRLEPLLSDLEAKGIETYLSPVFKTPEELERGTPLLLDMVEDARVLYEERGILTNALERLRTRLASLGARRVFRGNAWHWVLKRDFRPGEVFDL